MSLTLLQYLYSVNRLLFMIQSLFPLADLTLMPYPHKSSPVQILACQQAGERQTWPLFLVSLCCYVDTLKSTDFTSGKVCGPSSSFWGVCRFRPTSRWTLGADPPACRNLFGPGEGRTGAPQHQVGGDGPDLRGRNLHWQPCR